jgi:hypothetical protein
MRCLVRWLISTLRDRIVSAIRALVSAECFPPRSIAYPFDKRQLA